MRKRLAILLIGIMMMVTVLQVSAASLPAASYSSSEQTQWTMGFKKNVNGMRTGVQGSNGWYCLYTMETNKGGSFDVSKMKPTKWTATSNCWKYYGVSKNWSPDIYLGSGYDFSGNSNWWLMDGNGRMDPNVTKGAVSGAYAWAAPADGNYKISVDYTAGGSNQEYEENGVKVRYYAEDGVTLSMNTASKVLSKVNAPATSEKNPKLSQGNMTKTVTLKSGELVYFIVDPQNKGGYDYAQLSINILATEDKTDEEKEEESGTGNGEGEGSGNGTGSGTTGGAEESETGNGSGTGNGTGTGNESGSGSGAPSKPDNNTSAPMMGMPSTGLPSASTNVEDEPAENTKEEIDTKEGSLFSLSGDAVEELGTQTEEEQGTEEESGSEEEEKSGGSGETDMESSGEKPVILLVVGLLEALVSGVVLAAGKFYFYA